MNHTNMKCKNDLLEKFYPLNNVRGLEEISLMEMTIWVGGVAGGADPPCQNAGWIELTHFRYLGSKSQSNRYFGGLTHL